MLVCYHRALGIRVADVALDELAPYSGEDQANNCPCVPRIRRSLRRVYSGTRTTLSHSASPDSHRACR